MNMKKIASMILHYIILQPFIFMHANEIGSINKFIMTFLSSITLLRKVNWCITGKITAQLRAMPE